ncbi:unnamed protein product [Mesocestoides corti]|uniref:MARVEL domain-containing protein n=1 Tax=Mesocestoides corti TaxID=53468 RepID=A0A0R3U5W1_MESCO|nr:unnamed protein product [Mesocestoides corti]
MDIRRLNCALLCLAITFTVIALATNQWDGGNLLQNNRHDAALAVGSLLCVGVILLSVALIINIVQLCLDTKSGALHLAFLVTLFIGATALLIGILVYTGILSKQWSFFVAVVGCTFALHVAILSAAFSKCTIKHSSTTHRSGRVIRTH